jgi:anaerobic dimethyl sulfoxide reductase subunit B (iron-sulfur subunit)
MPGNPVVPQQGATANTPYPPGKQYGFFFDQGRCISCMNCMLACQEWNFLPVATEENATGKWMRVYQWESGAYPNTRLFCLAVPCYHCENPVCVDRANGSMYKEPKYGAVLIDPAKATDPELRDANEVCPYGAIVFESDAIGAKASKCTMCIDRLEQGLAPICTLACDMRVWDFGPLEDLQAKYGTLRQLKGQSSLDEMPDPSVVKPAVVFKPQLDRKQIVPYDANKALDLWQQRGPNALTGTFPNPFQVVPVDAPLVFGNKADVLDPQLGLTGRNRLQLKHPNNASLHFHTIVDE